MRIKLWHSTMLLVCAAGLVGGLTGCPPGGGGGGGGGNNNQNGGGGGNQNGGGGGGNNNQNGGGGVATLRAASRSSTIALTSDDRFLVVPNRDVDTVSIIEVRNAAGADVANAPVEVRVGNEPRYVSIHPNNREAYVTNAIDGTVSVIALDGTNSRVIDTITVGTEPRGCAVTPNGARLYVANHTEGTVSAINLQTRQVVGSVNVGGNPIALAITNNGNTDDLDERVFVTLFYAQPRAGADSEVNDEGKEGVVESFAVGNPGSPVRIALSPLQNSGFTANRAPFCPAVTMTAVNDFFCPATGVTDPMAPAIIMDPQGVYPNQLWSCIIRNNRLLVPNIGAAPEPPVRFNVNVQALVHVADTSALSEVTNLQVNLNQQVAQERMATPMDQLVAGNLKGLFGNDLVDIDATTDGRTFLIVSRGGNYVFRATLDNDGRLSLNQPNIVRIRTGNLPNGVVINSNGTRAYTNNEAGYSVTAIDLQNNSTMQLDISSSAPPAPGSDAHRVLLGKLVFFTALGVPNNGIFNTPIRNIVPLDNRGKASDNAWSGCGSCHPDGLADGVTWSFGTGPRQTIPLDAFFSKIDPNDQRISNYSAIMGSTTDFNNNSRGVQGGTGFVDDPMRVFPHGITTGASDAQDALTAWVRTVRAFNVPQPSDTAALARGRNLFETNCASCHGGAKWTKSQVIYINNPTFLSDPTPGGVPPRDNRVTNMGAQIVSFTNNGMTLRFLDGVGTFNAADPKEIRGAGMQGTGAAGGAGFNAPSLLSITYHAPYLHNGAAQTLEDVLDVHLITPGGMPISTALNASQQSDLLTFVRSIDSRTATFRSATDDFPR
ncbi:MAG TPA: beta-propeller fold lactonase family protein [Phycisphaerae bacterium]|jgi:YVTN family beta-propeller protein